jgi:hypothetical protein
MRRVVAVGMPPPGGTTTNTDVEIRSGNPAGVTPAATMWCSPGVALDGTDMTFVNRPLESVVAQPSVAGVEWKVS